MSDQKTMYSKQAVYMILELTCWRDQLGYFVSAMRQIHEKLDPPPLTLIFGYMFKRLQPPSLVPCMVDCRSVFLAVCMNVFSLW